MSKGRFIYVCNEFLIEFSILLENYPCDKNESKIKVFLDKNTQIHFLIKQITSKGRRNYYGGSIIFRKEILMSTSIHI